MVKNKSGEACKKNWSWDFKISYSDWLTAEQILLAIKKKK